MTAIVYMPIMRRRVILNPDIRRVSNSDIKLALHSLDNRPYKRIIEPFVPNL